MAQHGRRADSEVCAQENSPKLYPKLCTDPSRAAKTFRAALVAKNPLATLLAGFSTSYLSTSVINVCVCVLDDALELSK